jgi:hypothetical protein
MVGMLASFPFVSGEPGPGPEKADPTWFGPVVVCLLVAAGLGVLLVGASAIYSLILRRSELR